MRWVPSSGSSRQAFAFGKLNGGTAANPCEFPSLYQHQLADLARAKLMTVKPLAGRFRSLRQVKLCRGRPNLSDSSNRL